MKKLLAILVIAASITGLFLAPAPQAADNRADDVSTFMRAKLEDSKKVLEGLATEDYELIAKHGQQLTLLSLDADWQVIKTAKYAEHSLAFRETSQKLTEAAQKKNLDGATLAYVELTLKCVQCHKYIRTVDRASLDDSLNPSRPIGRDTAATSLHHSAFTQLVATSDE